MNMEPVLRHFSKILFTSLSIFGIDCRLDHGLNVSLVIESGALWLCFSSF